MLGFVALVIWVRRFVGSIEEEEFSFGGSRKIWERLKGKALRSEGFLLLIHRRSARARRREHFWEGWAMAGRFGLVDIGWWPEAGRTEGVGWERCGKVFRVSTCVCMEVIEQKSFRRPFHWRTGPQPRLHLVLATFQSWVPFSWRLDLDLISYNVWTSEVCILPGLQKWLLKVLEEINLESRCQDLLLVSSVCFGVRPPAVLVRRVVSGWKPWAFCRLLRLLALLVGHVGGWVGSGGFYSCPAFDVPFLLLEMVWRLLEAGLVMFLPCWLQFCARAEVLLWHYEPRRTPIF